MTAWPGPRPLLQRTAPAAILAALFFLVASPVSPQRPEVDVPALSLDSFVVGLVAGASAAYTLPSGEGLGHLSGGAGYDVFAGFRLTRHREFRVGWLRTWHDDLVNGGEVSLRSLSAEMRWALERGRMLLRAAPRLAFYMFRAEDLTQSGPTIGATFAPQLRLGRGWLLDGALSGDVGTFPPRPPNNPQDERVGTVWSIRLGLAWQP